MALPNRTLQPTLEELEDAVVAALEADATIAAYAKSITAFQGELDELEAALAKVALREPAFLVLVGGGEFIERGVEDYACTVELHVILRARNLRGPRARRAPQAAGEVGTYQMLQDALRVLTLQDFDLTGLAPLVPSSFELVQSASARDRTSSIYVQAFTAEVDLVVLAPDQTLDTVQADYELRNADADTWETGHGADTITTEEG